MNIIQTWSPTKDYIFGPASVWTRASHIAKQHLYYFGINLGFWETAHLPLPKANINTYLSLQVK